MFLKQLLPSTRYSPFLLKWRGSVSKDYRGENANANADANNSNIYIHIGKMWIMVFDIRICAVNTNNKCGYYLLSAFKVMGSRSPQIPKGIRGY
jgi:hypothetical protein